MKKSPAPVPAEPRKRWRQITVIAQDPSVKSGNRILRAQARVPWEEMGDGPRGYRVQVVDYDATSDTLMRPWQPPANNGDPFLHATDAELLANPQFHQQNVYAIVMRTLGRFEHALGRRVSWSFGGHQLKVAPHAFTDANAFYSKDDEALLFGYFPAKSSRKRMVFSCLSHDVVAHETTHALLDGLRSRYTDSSSADQAAFHEGFSDIVALLSIFSLKGVVEALLRRKYPKKQRIAAREMKVEKLKEHTLITLADEMGEEMMLVRGKALRESVKLRARPGILKEKEFREEHRRGEVLVAAVMGSFVEIWAARVTGLAQDESGSLDVVRVAEEGCSLADRLLTMCIRALDYCPPVHLEFPDYLSALLTGDREMFPDDSRLEFRRRIRERFAAFGIKPAARNAEGVWQSPEINQGAQLVYDRTHFESMQRDKDEVFRFVWENRRALDLYEPAWTRVENVRPCIRTEDDGFMLRETVADYVQVLRLKPEDLAKHGYHRPKEGLPDNVEVWLHGGGVLIFDEYGRLKFHVHNRLKSPEQDARIAYFANSGYYLSQRPARKPSARLSAFGLLHNQRALGGARASEGCGCHGGGEAHSGNGDPETDDHDETD